MNTLSTTFTPQEVAAALQVSLQTVYRAVQRGEIKAFKTGRVWRITEEEVQRIYAEGFRSGTAKDES